MSSSGSDYVTLHYEAILKDLYSQVSKEQFTDCTLSAEGKTLKAHKAILCAQSSFLQILLSEHTATDTCLLIEGIAYEDLKKLVHFVYNGSVKVNRENVGSFLVAAELLGMKWMNQVDICDAESSANTTKRVVFEDITNTMDSKGVLVKRRKHSKVKKCCKKSKRGGEKHELIRVLNAVDIGECITDKENHIAQVDENTFYTALGLKKNTVSVPAAAAAVVAAAAAKSKSIPNLIRINRAGKMAAAEVQCDNANVFVSEMNTVYIEDKNLSFLNEVCIRESNIEIECDVLDASSEFVIEKDGAAVANVVELREKNHSYVSSVNRNYKKSNNRSTTTVDHDKSVPTTTSVTPRMMTATTTTTATTTASLAKSVVSVTAASTATKKRVMGSLDRTCTEEGLVALFWCDICRRTYHTKTGLNQHKRYECCKEPAFACPRCEKRFKRKSSLVRHAITLHDEAIFPTRTKLLRKLTSSAQGDKTMLTISEERSGAVTPVEKDASGSKSSKGSPALSRKSLKGPSPLAAEKEEQRKSNISHTTRSVAAAAAAAAASAPTAISREKEKNTGSSSTANLSNGIDEDLVFPSCSGLHLKNFTSAAKSNAATKRGTNADDDLSDSDLTVESYDLNHDPCRRRLLRKERDHSPSLVSCSSFDCDDDTSQNERTETATEEEEANHANGNATSIDLSSDSEVNSDRAPSVVLFDLTVTSDTEARTVSAPAPKSGIRIERRKRLPKDGVASFATGNGSNFAKPSSGPLSYRRALFGAQVATKRTFPRGKRYEHSHRNSAIEAVDEQQQQLREELLKKTFNLKPFAIKLSQVRKEKTEYAKRSFLSNFNLKRRGSLSGSGASDIDGVANGSELRVRKTAFLQARMRRKSGTGPRVERPGPKLKRIRFMPGTPLFSCLRPLTVQLEKLEGNPLADSVKNDHNYSFYEQEKKAAAAAVSGGEVN